MFDQPNLRGLVLDELAKGVVLLLEALIFKDGLSEGCMELVEVSMTLS